MSYDLECRDVVRTFGNHVAVDCVSLGVKQGSFFSILGPSGCGKTTLLRMVAGFGQPSSGDILIKGASVLHTPPNKRPVNMVFQHLALFPMMSVAANIAYGLKRKGGMSGSVIDKKVNEALERVGLPGSGHKQVTQLSGGQRQRVAIARALVRHPSFVIADEPVSSLDVTVRAQVLELFAQLQQRHGFSCLFISHDLGVVEQIADRVLVMQDGRIIEQGSRDAIFDQPQQAYTRALLSAIPVLLPTPGGGMQLKWRFDETRPCHLRPSAQSADESILQSADDADSHGVGNRLN